MAESYYSNMVIPADAGASTSTGDGGCCGGGGPTGAQPAQAAQEQRSDAIGAAITRDGSAGGTCPGDVRGGGRGRGRGSCLPWVLALAAIVVIAVVRE